MTTQNHFVGLAAVGGILLFCVSGCTMQYNGAWGAKNNSAAPRPSAAVAKAAAPTPGLTPQVAERSEESAKPVANAPQGIQFTTPDLAAAPEGGARPAGDRSLVRSTMESLRLFGNLPGAGSASGGSSGQAEGTDNLRRVTFAAEGADFDPAIDPTGKFLVFASTQHRQTADLYLKKIDGSSVTQLTNDPSNDVMPTFSPDGKKIAFASDRSGNWDIYVISADGGQAVQLTNDATQDLHPSFSPDGKQLVYCTYGTQSSQWELVVIDVENPATKRFVGYGLFPDWSPTDNRILFQRARERGTRWFGVWTIDLVNGEGVRPTEVAASTNAAVITPRWSPDGKHIVACTVVNPSQGSDTAKPAQADVWVLAADGTGRSNLTNSQFANLQPVWAKDGTIFFVSNRGGGGAENIWAIRPDSALKVAQPGTTPSAATAMRSTEPTIEHSVAPAPHHDETATALTSWALPLARPQTPAPAAATPEPGEAGPHDNNAAALVPTE